MTMISPAPFLPFGDRAVGAVAGSTAETAAIVLKPRDESAVTNFIASVTNKNSPIYHHYLAPGAYRSRFGPSAAAVSAVESQLRADGLKVRGVASDGLIVTFSGTASRVERAFDTRLESYRLAGGGLGFATTTPVRFPATIAPAISGVVGLDNLLQAHSTDIAPGPRSGVRVAAQAAKFAASDGIAERLHARGLQTRKAQAVSPTTKSPTLTGPSACTPPATSARASTSESSRHSHSLPPTSRPSTAATSARPRPRRCPATEETSPAVVFR